MNPNVIPRWMTLPFLTMLTIIACSLPALVTSPPPEPTATQNIQAELQATDTLEPTLTQTLPATESATETIAASPSPSARCTVLQDLNLRFGPGIAYRPRIRVLAANSAVTPLGFAPQGIPSGRWAYVQDSASQDKGWVSAGSQYIACNVDVTAMSLVAFGTPPPPPLPNTAQTSPGPGTCGDGGVISDNGIDVYDCSVVFSNDWLVQIRIVKNGIEIGETGGVQNVNFLVTQNGDEVYSHTENGAPYCIFGGDGPCNSWVLEDYFYKWEAGGPPVEAREYNVSISPSLDDPSVNLFWSADITMALP